MRDQDRKRTTTPEVPMELTGDADVLLGCRFTMKQVVALAAGVVPPEVQRFFEASRHLLQDSLRPDEHIPPTRS